MRFRSLLIAALVLLVTMVVPATAMAERTIGLSSGTFSFDVEPSGSATGTVDVMNDGDEPLTVLVYAADQKVDARGEITYVTPGRDQSLSNDPASWITITLPADTQSIGNVPTLSLEPGERIPVDFSITVPSNVAPGDHNILMFFEMQGAAPDGQAGAAVQGRVGARVRLRVGGSVSRKLSVRPFSVPSFVIGDRIPFSFTLNNEGNVDERVTATLALMDRGENALASTTGVDAKTVFANSSLVATGTLVAGKQVLGARTALLSVVPQTPDEALKGASAAFEKELTVWMVPQWAVVIFGALLLVLLGGIFYSIGRRLFGKKTNGVAADTGVFNPLPDEQGD